MPAHTPARLAVVLKGYPRLSETFIAQEILALEKRGLALQLVSLRHPTDPATHPVHDEIKAPILYLPEYLSDERARVWRAWHHARRLPGYRRALGAFFRDWRRDPTRNRLRRFGQACVLAAELPAGISWLYAHFLHTPASVTRYAALMTGLPWSISAHAKDIWTSAAWDSRQKLAEAEWLVTCSAVGAQELRSLAPDPARVHLVYHGLDFDRFDPPQPRYSIADGSDPENPVSLFSVGRLVEKKGYPDLLDALALLPESLHWRLVHIGAGEMAEGIKAKADLLGLTPSITWRGAQPQTEVLAQYRLADIFVLASRIARDGDRDGLPNVLMEAQSQGLPCLATEVSAIPELILQEKTGLMVPPQDPEKLSVGLQRLIAAPQLRRQLGQAGQNRVRDQFAMDRGIDRLMDLLDAPAKRRAAE